MVQGGWKEGDSSTSLAEIFPACATRLIAADNPNFSTHHTVVLIILVSAGCRCRSLGAIDRVSGSLYRSSQTTEHPMVDRTCPSVRATAHSTCSVHTTGLRLGSPWGLRATSAGLACPQSMSGIIIALNGRSGVRLPFPLGPAIQPDGYRLGRVETYELRAHLMRIAV